MSPRATLAAIVAGAILAIGFVLGPAAALTPDIDPGGPEVPTRHPQPARTAHSGAPGTPPISKPELIIQQNVNCWIGVPGATCGPERTYV